MNYVKFFYPIVCWCVDCVQTSNLMLIESISREPLQFHVLPFDAPKVRHALQVFLTNMHCNYSACRTVDSCVLHVLTMIRAVLTSRST